MGLVEERRTRQADDEAFGVGVALACRVGGEEAWVAASLGAALEAQGDALACSRGSGSLPPGSGSRGRPGRRRLGRRRSGRRRRGSLLTLIGAHEVGFRVKLGLST